MASTAVCAPPIPTDGEPVEEEESAPELATEAAIVPPVPPVKPPAPPATSYGDSSNPDEDR